MLAQFQARYPQSSLISDLLTIYQGKFVVRVSAQVEGVTRATGMAAAETLELAEDKARERAIAVLAIDVIAPPKSQQQENNDQSIPSQAPDIQLSSAMPQASQINAVEASSIPQTNHRTATTDLNDSISVSPASLVESTPDQLIPLFESKSDVDEQDYLNLQSPLAEMGVTNIQRFPMVPRQEQELDAVEHIETISDTQPATSGNLPFLNNVTPLKPRTYTPESPIPLDQTVAQTNIVAPSEPIDLSDAIAKIDVQLKHLRWTKNQERKYLERTYGKESRELLTDEQLFEFLDYLELFGQTNRALEDLEWSNEEGRNYLIQTYNKQSRQHLTNQELMEFLQHLKAERDRK